MLFAINGYSITTIMFDRHITNFSDVLVETVSAVHVLNFTNYYNKFLKI